MASQPKAAAPLPESSARPPLPVLGGRGATGAGFSVVDWGATCPGVFGVEGRTLGGGVTPATMMVVVGVLVTDGVGLGVAVLVTVAVGVAVTVGVGVA